MVRKCVVGSRGKQYGCHMEKVPGGSSVETVVVREALGPGLGGGEG